MGGLGPRLAQVWLWATWCNWINTTHCLEQHQSVAWYVQAGSASDLHVAPRTEWITAQRLLEHVGKQEPPVLGFRKSELFLEFKQKIKLSWQSCHVAKIVYRQISKDGWPAIQSQEWNHRSRSDNENTNR